jgi:hypothetical protein
VIAHGLEGLEDGAQEPGELVDEERGADDQEHPDFLGAVEEERSADEGEGESDQTERRPERDPRREQLREPLPVAGQFADDRALEPEAADNEEERDE